MYMYMVQETLAMNFQLTKLVKSWGIWLEGFSYIKGGFFCYSTSLCGVRSLVGNVHVCVWVGGGI